MIPALCNFSLNEIYVSMYKEIRISYIVDPFISIDLIAFWCIVG